MASMEGDQRRGEYAESRETGLHLEWRVVNVTLEVPLLTPGYLGVW